MTTYIGEEAEFRCIAPYNGISWFINDTNVAAVQFIETERRFTARKDGCPGEESVLVITTNAIANNSAIKCSVRDRNSIRIHSSEAHLRFQGIITYHHKISMLCGFSMQHQKVGPANG